jgi:hypothetical protein
MNIAELSIHKKVIVLFITFLIIGGGIFAYENMGRLEDPEFTIKVAKVVTLYPGASAEEVQREVTDVLETAIQQMPQLWRITSQSMDGSPSSRRRSSRPTRHRRCRRSGTNSGARWATRNPACRPACAPRS